MPSSDRNVITYNTHSELPHVLHFDKMQPFPPTHPKEKEKKKIKKNDGGGLMSNTISLNKNSTVSKTYTLRSYPGFGPGA